MAWRIRVGGKRVETDSNQVAFYGPERSCSPPAKTELKALLETITARIARHLTREPDAEAGI